MFRQVVPPEVSAGRLERRSEEWDETAQTSKTMWSSVEDLKVNVVKDTGNIQQ